MSLSYGISIILILTATCYFSLGLLINSIVKRTYMRRLCLFAFSALALRNLFYALMVISCCYEYARFYWSLGFFIVFAFFPCWLLFLIYLTSKITLKKLILIIIHYIITAWIVIICINSNVVQIVESFYGYKNHYNISPIFIICLINVALYIIMMTVLLVNWLHTVELKRVKKMALLMILMTSVFLPAMILIDFSQAFFFNLSNPPIGSILLVIVVIQLYRIMKTYRAFDITIENVSQDMYASLTIPVLILNNENKIIFVNNFSNNYLLGIIKERNIADVISFDKKKPEKSFFNESFENVSATIYTRDGIKNCNMHLTVVKDDFGDDLHKIVIISDTTELIDARKGMEDRLKLLIDNIPIPITIWSQDIKLIGCNQEAMKQIEVDNKDDFLSAYSKCMPEYQKNGIKTSEYITQEIKKTLEIGYNYVNWTHLTRDGDLIDMDLTLVRVEISDNKYEVLCYVKWL